MTGRLQLGPDLSVPIDVVTQTLAILAVRRAGKSNAAVVLAEEMHKAGLPWVAIDPKGDWWGLRSSADGTGPGIPVPILGGLHGDLPLEPGAGAMVAELVVAENLTCVLDISDFASNAARNRFVADFGSHLFRLHGKDPQPRHVILEEADEIIPQVVRRDEGNLAVSVGVWSKLVKQGGQRGLGSTIVSQRSASVNKTPLNQTETLIALRTTAPTDRDAIKEWVRYHSVGDEIVASLHGLADGEAWVISPHWLGGVTKHHFRRRSTFDSGATPKVGELRRVTGLADINLDVVRKQMSDVIQKAEAEDPKRLRRRIAELERENARLASARPEPERVEVEVVVPAFPKELIDPLKELHTLAERFSCLAADFGHAASDISDGALDLVPARIPPGKPERSRIGVRREENRSTFLPKITPVDGEVQLKAGARRILATIAQHHPLALTKAQVGTLSGFKASGGTFGEYYGKLRREQLIEVGSDGLVRVTERGIAESGVDVGDPLTTEEVIDRWRSSLKAGARKMLDSLIEVYPRDISRDELAAAAGFEPSGGTFGEYLGTLRRNGLAEVEAGRVRAGEALFLR